MRWPLLSIAVFVAACPRPRERPAPIRPDVVDAAPPFVPPASLDEANRLLAPAQCDWNVRCGVIAESQRKECELGPPPAGRLTLVWGDPRNDTLRMSLADGRVRFDPSRVAECVEAWRTSSCHPIVGEGPWSACAMFPPKVTAGGKCRFWNECIDAHCSGQTACDGVCVPHLPRGAACTATGNEGLCGDDDFCEPTSFVCVPRRTVGASCLHWQTCRAPMRCVGVMTVRDHPGAPEVTVPGKCTMPGTTGVACRPGWSVDCDSDFACDYATSTCRPRIKKGGACTSPESCTDGHACIGGVCAPYLDLESPCDPSSIETGCPRSTGCDPTSRRCVSHAHDGDPCHPNGGCNSNLFCDPKSHTCKPALALGQACTPSPAGEDEPCFIGRCDPKTRICTATCGK